MKCSLPWLLVACGTTFHLANAFLVPSFVHRSPGLMTGASSLPAPETVVRKYQTYLAVLAENPLSTVNSAGDNEDDPQNSFLPDIPPDMSFLVNPEFYHNDFDTNNFEANGHQESEENGLETKVVDEMPPTQETMQAVSLPSPGRSSVDPPPPTTENDYQQAVEPSTENRLASPMADFVDNQFGTVEHGLTQPKVTEVPPRNAHVNALELPAADRFCYKDTHTVVSKTAVTIPAQADMEPRISYVTFQRDNDRNFNMWDLLQVFQAHLPAPNSEGGTSSVVDKDNNAAQRSPPPVNGSTMPYPPLNAALYPSNALSENVDTEVTDVPVDPTTTMTTSTPDIQETNESELTASFMDNIVVEANHEEALEDFFLDISTTQEVFDSLVDPAIGMTAMQDVPSQLVEVAEPREDEFVYEEDVLATLHATEESDDAFASLVVETSSSDGVDHPVLGSQSDDFLEDNGELDTLTFEQAMDDELLDEEDLVAPSTSNGVAEHESTTALADTADNESSEKREKIMDALALGGLATVGLMGVSSAIGIEVGTLMDIALVGVAANAFANVGNSVKTTMNGMEDPTLGKLEPPFTAYEPGDEKDD